MKLVGYSDRIFARPGDKIEFKVSSEEPTKYDAEIVKIICGDDNPLGPGVKEAIMPSNISGTYLAERQRIFAGSYVHVGTAAAVRISDGFTIQAFVWPTTPDKGTQGILTRRSPVDGVGFGLVLDDEGAIAFDSYDSNGRISRVSTGRRLFARRWYLVGVSYDARTHIVRVFQRALLELPGNADGGEMQAEVGGLDPTVEGPILIAAMLDGDTSEVGFHFNGKIDRPRVTSRVLTSGEIDALTLSIPKNLDADVVAAWDFSIKMESQIAYDLSQNQLHGRVINLPARAMAGFNWTGEVMNFNEDPEQWGAIHFHDDDVYDADWKTSFTLDVEEEMKSGLYAAKLNAEGEEEYIPFTVGPRPGDEREIVLVLPTASYMAYGNDRLGMDGGGAELLNNILNVINPHEIFLNDHIEYGGSLYDTHSDGSGICYSSRMRPIVNMRPKRQGTLGGFGHSKLWQFAADTHIIDWLEECGYKFDVITDEELHYRGYELIAPYKVLITGTHPEYCSTEMWDAVDAFRKRGGRLMYLGGDGFYWRVAFHPELPGVIELRRAESGVRAWEALPGEYYQSFDGRHGGLWLRQGKSPQSLVGVGFAAQGFDLSTYYRRTPESSNPEVSFVFKGVDDEIIGDFGLIAGGAGGLEVDRAEVGLGTPPNAIVLASTENLTNTYLMVPEEFLETAPGLGAAENINARGDLVFFSMPGGGAVFSVGSIAWCGSLSHNNYQNNVSAITGNVLKRFLDAAPF